MPQHALPPIAHVASQAANDGVAYALGPHLIQGFAGTKPDDPGVIDLRRRAEAGELGGVIFFSYNIEGPQQLQQLTHFVASWKVPAKNAPLLLMVDQEGGHVQRLKHSHGFHGWPGARAISEMADAAAEENLVGMANELAGVGFNVNLAPVVDLWAPSNGLIGATGRSYGSEPQRVAELAGRQIAAQRAKGLASVVKHFPGHGLSRGDTHADLVDATRSWRSKELQPFARLFKAGQVDLLMSAHLVHRTLEPSGAPLTFSRALMQDTLRGAMHYHGVLMTDDLGMGAISRHYSVEQAVVGALGSSHDLLLFGLNEAAKGHGAERHRPIHDLFGRGTAAVQAALAAGSLTPELLAQSDARLLKFRRKLPVHPPRGLANAAAPQTRPTSPRVHRR